MWVKNSKYSIGLYNLHSWSNKNNQSPNCQFLFCLRSNKTIPNRYSFLHIMYPQIPRFLFSTCIYWNIGSLWSPSWSQLLKLIWIKMPIGFVSNLRELIFHDSDIIANKRKMDACQKSHTDLRYLFVGTIVGCVFYIFKCALENKGRLFSKNFQMNPYLIISWFYVRGSRNFSNGRFGSRRTKRRLR